MLAVQVKTNNFSQKVRKFAEVPNAIKRTVIFSLNDTVDDLHARQLVEMDRAFDRPTRFIKRGLRKRYAAGRPRPGFRAPGAEVAGLYFEEFGGSITPEEVIKPHVFGGSRKQKPNERRLADAIWRDSEGNAYNVGGGFYAMMGQGYPRNKHGNITPARYSEMLSKLGTIDTARPGQKRRKGNTKGYFISAKGGRPSAVMERKGKNVQVMLSLTRKPPQYRKRYRYFEVGRDQVTVSLPRHFNRIMNKEIKRIMG